MESNYIRPFEGNRKAGVAPSENEFDSPALFQSICVTTVQKKLVLTNSLSECYP